MKCNLSPKIYAQDKCYSSSPPNPNENEFFRNCIFSSESTTGSSFMST